MSAGLVVDLFAGGGGASTGVEAALGRPVDLAVNHSWDALRVHHMNHPGTRHMVEDIREVSPMLATGGQPVDTLWASPDCRHFSRAKGGKPCHPEVRLLPWQVVRWAKETRPRLIAMENVPEFMGWGPLGDDNRPLPERAGETFEEWVAALRGLGYDVAWRVLTACDYGTPTSRKRLFVVARRDGEVRWPAPTHGPGLLPYRTVAECLDWSDLGTSIFERSKPLAEATQRRIARGLVKFVLEAKRPYLVQTGYGEREGQAPRCMSLDKPLGTIVAGGSKHALCVAWIAKHYGGVTGHGPSRPLGTITATDSHGLAVAHTCGGGDPKQVAAFLTTYYGQSVGQRVDAPLGTITTHDRHGLVAVELDGESHVVTDISMRMLKPSELKLAQGFPADYRLEGPAKLQTRLVGNSVPPQLSEAVVRANTPLSLRRRVA